MLKMIKVFPRKEAYGTVGEQTNIKDADGKQLNVGDLVSVYDPKTGKKQLQFVVKNGGKTYIMGLFWAVSDNGIISHYKVKLYKSYKDVKAGDMAHGIKVVS